MKLSSTEFVELLQVGKMEEKTKDIDYYQTYLPPPQLGKWDSFKLFVWNSERREFLGRTGSSWLKVTVFYIIFYICLAAFFAVMLIIFYQTLDNFKPKWTLDNSLIGDNPGLGFRPMPKSDNVDSTLIWFKQGEKPNWKHWVNSLDAFLEPYTADKQFGDKFSPCSDGNPAPEGKVCSFDISKLENCSLGTNYGYDKGRPCVFIKMNRIWGWEPKPYTINDSLPRDMSQRVKDNIAASKGKAMIWVACEGENPADKENIGQLKYFPQAGFPVYYFPYTNTPGYLSPIVAVLFEKLTPGVLVNVECKAWTKNIVHGKMERRGSVHFEMLMD